MSPLDALRPKERSTNPYIPSNAVNIVLLERTSHPLVGNLPAMGKLSEPITGVQADLLNAVLEKMVKHIPDEDAQTTAPRHQRTFWAASNMRVGQARGLAAYIADIWPNIPHVERSVLADVMRCFNNDPSAGKAKLSSAYPDTDTDHRYRVFSKGFDVTGSPEGILGVERGHPKWKAAEDALNRYSGDGEQCVTPEMAAPVRILIELSQNMAGHEIFSIISAVRAAGDRLHASGSDFEILGHGTVKGGGKSALAWKSSGKPAGMSRVQDLRHLVFKGMTEDWGKARERLPLALVGRLLADKVPGEAIEWTAGRAREDADISGLIHICSDFQERSDHLNIFDLRQHYRGEIKALPEEGIAVRRITVDRANAEPVSMELNCPEVSINAGDLKAHQGRASAGDAPMLAAINAALTSLNNQFITELEADPDLTLVSLDGA